MTGVDLHISYASDGAFELRPTEDHYRFEVVFGDLGVMWLSIDKRVLDAEANRDTLLNELDVWAARARAALTDLVPEPKPLLQLVSAGSRWYR